jgi:EpsI family protein
MTNMTALHPHRASTPTSRLGTRREFLLGSACLAAAGAAFARKPRRHVEFLGEAKIDALVPRQFGEWDFVDSSGLVLPPEDQLKDTLYTQLLTRTYSNAQGQQVMLLIAYNPSQDGMVQVHRPEVCYPASGYRLTTINEHIVPLATDVNIPARHVIAETGLRREEIIYWTRLGSYFPQLWSEQRWAVFMQNLRGDIPDGLLIRFSSVMADVGVEALDNFARELFQHLDSRMRRVLAGAR